MDTRILLTDCESTTIQGIWQALLTAFLFPQLRPFFQGGPRRPVVRVVLAYPLAPATAALIVFE